MTVILVVCSAVGLFCIRAGVLLWKRQRISLLHDYHTASVRDEDIPAYTRKTGIGMIVIGTGVLFAGILCFILQTPAGMLCLPAGLAVGLPFICTAQKRYGRSRKN